MSLRTLLCTIPCLVCAPALAQTPFKFRHQGTTSWPSCYSAPGTFQRQVAVDLDDNGLMDIVLLEGGKPVAFAAPDSCEAALVLANTGDPALDDLAVIPPSASAGSALALVGPDGLQRLSFNPGTIPSGSTEVVDLFERRLVDAHTNDEWIDALKVATFLDSDGSPSYVGLEADGSTIVLRRQVGGSVVQTTFAIGYSASQIGTLQWGDGSAGFKIWTLCDYGVILFNLDGTRSRLFARVASGVEAICSFKKKVLVGSVLVAENRERLAWVRQRNTTPATQELVELSKANSLVTSAVVFPDTDFVSAAVAADLPANENPPDGSDELILSHAASQAPYVLLDLCNQDTDGSFSNQSTDAWRTLHVSGVSPDSTSLAGSNAMIACTAVDQNADGFPDVFVPVANGSSSYFELYRTDLGGVHPVLDGSGTSVASAMLQSTASAYFETELTAGFPAALNFRFAADASVPGNTTALEIVLWQRDTGGYYTELLHAYYTLQPEEIGAVFDRMLPIPFTDDDPETRCFAEQYWVEFRYAYVDTNGKLIALSRSYITAFSSNYTEMLGLANSGYSYFSCVEGMAGCSTSACEGGGLYCPGCGQSEPIARPTTMTRRRLPPPTSGSFPAPSTGAPVHLE